MKKSKNYSNNNKEKNKNNKILHFSVNQWFSNTIGAICYFFLLLFPFLMSQLRICIMCQFWIVWSFPITKKVFDPILILPNLLVGHRFPLVS